MASSGIRLDGMPLLKLSNPQDSKLIVYENEKEEYFTFITPECKNTRPLFGYAFPLRGKTGQKFLFDKRAVRYKGPVSDQQTKTINHGYGQIQN